MESKAKDLITGSTRVSSLPESFLMMHDILHDPNSSYSDIAKIISLDTALSVKLLKIVNSSLFNFPSAIETITHAISLVGTEQLYELALATTVLTSFNGISEENINMEQFWRHSLAVGIIARNLAIHRREPNPERFYLAGILHDVGRLIILENLPEQAQEIFYRNKEEKGLIHKIEKEVLGFDHTEVGACLAKAWKLPLSLEEYISCHHKPLEAQRFPIGTALVHLADIIAKAMELGSSGDPHLPPLEAEAFETVDLSPAVMSQVWNQVGPEYEENVEIVLSR